MNNLKEKLKALHEKTYSKQEDCKPYFNRLKFDPKAFYIHNPKNSEKISAFINFLEAQKAGSIYESTPDCLKGSPSEDILISTVDRYGFPIRTIYNMESELIRTDPYYTSDVLSKFYRDYYRGIYTWGYNEAEFFHEQHTRGVYFYKFILNVLGNMPRTVLDYGCGMGGTLLPFFLSQADCMGLDYGDDYVQIGKRSGLDLRTIDSDRVLNDLTDRKKFDLVILSHVIEHIKNPTQFLHDIKNVLSPKSILLIQVPLIESIPVDYGSDLLRYFQNAHVWSFCKKTLTDLMGNSGFRQLAHDGKNTFLFENKLTGKMTDEQQDQRCTILDEIKKFEFNFQKKHSLANRVRKKLSGYLNK